MYNYLAYAILLEQHKLTQKINIGSKKIKTCVDDKGHNQNSGERSKR